MANRSGRVAPFRCAPAPWTVATGTSTRIRIPVRRHRSRVSSAGRVAGPRRHRRLPRDDPRVPPPVKPAGLSADIAYLASRSLAGRGAGTPATTARRSSSRGGTRRSGSPGAFPGVCKAAETCRRGRTSSTSWVRRSAGTTSGRSSAAPIPICIASSSSSARTTITSARRRASRSIPISSPPTRPGADDNASGTAAVLELARRLAANPPARSVLLIHFDAEEWGLVGSRAFVQRPPVPARRSSSCSTSTWSGRLNGRDLLIDGSVGRRRRRARSPIAWRERSACPSARSNVSAGRSDHAVFGVDRRARAVAHHWLPRRLSPRHRRRVAHRRAGAHAHRDVAEGIVRAAARRAGRRATRPCHRTSSITTR